MQDTAIGCKGCSSWRVLRLPDMVPGWRPAPTCRTVSVELGQMSASGLVSWLPDPRRVLMKQNSYSPCDPSGSLDAEQLSRLTAEHVADRGESAVADGFGPVVLHDAEIDQRNADRFGVCSVW